MSVSMLCAVCVDPNLRGVSAFYGLGQEQVYYHEGRTELQSRGILRNLSSGIVWESHSCDATLILLDNNYYTLPFPIPGPDFSGSFLQLTNPKDSGSMLRLDHFSDYHFDNKTASLMEVNTYSLLRFSFRDLFLEEWKTQIDDGLGSSGWRRGDPVMTWEMWPVGVSYLNSNRCYLKIHQPIRINVPYWPDYDASITYHIYLWLDGNGHLHGSCVRWAYWVEGGMKSGQIADRLKPAVIAGCASLTEKVTEKLDEYSGLSFTELYYLPGRQINYPPASIITGHTLDDVTIVLDMA